MPSYTSRSRPFSGGFLLYATVNRWREEGRRTVAEIAYITSAQADWTQLSETKGALSDFRQASRWRKPEPGVLKLNSVNPETKEGGWGLVIRDEHGRRWRQDLVVKNISWTPFHAEALGCMAGLQAATRLGIMRINIEVDFSAQNSPRNRRV